MGLNTLVRYHIWIVVGFLLAGCGRSNSMPPLDPHIGDLERIRLVSGEKAIHAINKLHGMSIDVARGFIADYKGVGNKATIWVSEAASEDLAKKQIEIMIGKMKGSGKSPFRQYHTVKAKGMRVIGFHGLGQVHYVFRVKDWVYWISADGEHIDDILEHIDKNR